MIIEKNGSLHLIPETREDEKAIEIEFESARIERPEKMELRKRLLAYGLSNRLITSVLSLEAKYSLVIGALNGCKRKGKPLPGTLRKNLSGQIWKAKGMEDFVYLGKMEGKSLKIPRNLPVELDLSKAKDWSSNQDYGKLLYPPVEIKKRYTLRDYQAKALSDCTPSEISTDGMLVAPCGSGKTVMGCHWIHKIGLKTLVLVHTLDLANQWKDEIKKILGVDSGMVGGGDVDWQPITVATIQTLWRRSELVRKKLDDYGAVIVDECHHIPAQSFSDVIQMIGAKYRLGLTATPYREDGYTPIIHAHMGKIKTEIDHESLYESGSSVRPTVIKKALLCYYPRHDPVGEWAKFLTDLCENQTRNGEISEDIRDLFSSGFFSFGLVLCGRISQTKILADLLKEMGLKAEFIHGKLSKKKRVAILEDAKKGKFDILTATTIADEGLDLKNLDAAFFAAPGRAVGKTIQRIGRIMRKNTNKTNAYLVDFVDVNIGLLKNQWYSRRKAYKSIGANFA